MLFNNKGVTLMNAYLIVRNATVTNLLKRQKKISFVDLYFREILGRIAEFFLMIT